MAIVQSALPAPASPDPASSDPATGSGFNLDLARSLRMRRPLALTVGLVVFFLLLIVAFTRHPQYQATSLIYIQPLTSKTVTDTSAGSYDPSRYDSYIQQQLLTFVRPDILAQTLDQLPPATQRLLGANREILIAQLAANLKVVRPPGSYQVSVTLTGTNPVVITQIVNTVTAVYLKNGQQDDLAQSSDQLRALVAEREHIQAELDVDHKEQAGLSSALGVADTAADTGNPYDTQLGELRTQLAVARNAHHVALAQLAAALKNRSADDGTGDAITRSEPELVALKTSIATRRSALITQMTGLTPLNPLYQADQQELARLNQSLVDMTAKVSSKSGESARQQLVLEAARTGDVENRLASDLASQTAAATGNTPKLQRAADLGADIRRLQTRFTEIDAAVHSLSLEQSAGGLAHLSLAASQPTLPLPSKRPAILLFSIPFAFIFGATAAVIKQKLDPHIYIGQDITNTLNFPPMAILPDATEVSPKVMEEFVFRLVAGIDQAHRNRNARTFIFTASSENIDIKRIVSSLAYEMSLLGYRTLSMTAAEALRAKAYDERPSPWEGGNALATSNRNNSLEVRQESFVVGNLERLKQNVDLLFIEALPLRSSSEAEFAARHGDVTVLVAQSGHTTRSEMKNALSLVRRLGVRGVAAVLEDLRLFNADKEFIDSVHFAQRHESEIRTVTERPERRGQEGPMVNVYDGPERRA